MILSKALTLGGAAGVAALALFTAGCYYYAPAYPYDDAYYDDYPRYAYYGPYYHPYYAYPYYGPFTSLSVDIIAGGHGHGHDYGHDGHYWRGVPYRHYGGDRYRGDRHGYRGHGGWGRHADNGRGYGGRHGH